MDRVKHCRHWIWIFLTVALLLVSGCKVELYSNLNEKEANEMLAILLRQGIDSDKIEGKEMTWGLTVDKSDMAKAVGILQESGYPKDRFESIGNIFKKEGLVSSPLEERVRFIYALSQELSSTLSKIDGVLVARTQIVLPENDPLSDTLLPSSASVFIKHQPGFDLESAIPKIKKLVINSIEGLTYEKVTVVLFPAHESARISNKTGYQNVMGIRVAPESVGSLRIFMGLFLLLLIAALAGTGYFFLADKIFKKK